MYVSITGLKTKNFFSWFKFWVLAIPAFRAAQRAKGIIFCETKKIKNYHHMKAMQSFKNIATGKIWDLSKMKFNNAS